MYVVYSELRTSRRLAMIDDQFKKQITGDLPMICSILEVKAEHIRMKIGGACHPVISECPFKIIISRPSRNVAVSRFQTVLINHYYEKSIKI